MGRWQSIIESHWKRGHGLRDLRKCQEGEIYFGLKGQQRLFGELELGLSWEKDQGWVDRKNRVDSSGWGWWPGQTYRGSNFLFRTEDLQRLREGVSGKWWGEDHKHIVESGHRDKWCSIKHLTLGLRVSWKLSWLRPDSIFILVIPPLMEKQEKVVQITSGGPVSLDFSSSLDRYFLLPLNYSWALNNTGLNGAGLLICICFQEWILSSYVICIWLNLKILNSGFWTTSDKRTEYKLISRFLTVVENGCP